MSRGQDPGSSYTSYFHLVLLYANMLLPLLRAFNSGSPFNVPAGHTADLSELKDFYQRKNAETEAKQLEKLAARAGDSEVLAQRREVAGGGQEKRRTSISSILEDYGFKRAGK